MDPAAVSNLNSRHTYLDKHANMGNNNVPHAALISPRVDTRLVNVEETSVRAEDRKAQGPVHAKAGVLIKIRVPRHPV
jgi:hypothetical protein